jgi:multiple sugar transport system permease protein
LLGWLLLVPAAAALVAFVIGPMVANVFISLRDERLTTPSAPYVGLRNWEKLIDDGTIWSSLALTLVYTAITVAASVALALALALSLIDRPFLRPVVGAIVVLPVATALIVACAGWRLLFDVSGGINAALAWFGIAGPNWLNEPTPARVVIIVVGFWSMTGFALLVYQAALSRVPSSLIDAARLFDSWEGIRPKFRLVVPLLWRTTAVAILFSTIVALRAFDQIYALTSGGPYGTTQTLAFLSWQQSFQFYNLGAGAVAATILVLLVLVVSAVELAFLRRRQPAAP